MTQQSFSKLERLAESPSLDEPTPFTVAWWREQPPEALATTVRRFQQIGHKQPPAVRRYLEKHLPTLEVAEQFDRDLATFWKQVRK